MKNDGRYKFEHDTKGPSTILWLGGRAEGIPRQVAVAIEGGFKSDDLYLVRIYSVFDFGANQTQPKKMGAIEWYGGRVEIWPSVAKRILADLGLPEND